MDSAPRRAVLSVTDKTGIVEFARGLHAQGFELVSTGGTARALREAGLEVVEVGAYTGSPEILGGRVKTLHPRLLGGVLARPHLEADRADQDQQDIPSVQVVAVNLYRFEQAAEAFAPDSDAPQLTDAGVEAVIEQIDIGGPTMVRAAAKNARHVSVVVDPADYPRVLAAYTEGEGPDGRLRAALAAKAFRRIAEYDAAVDQFFTAYLAEPEAARESLPPALVGLASGALPGPLQQAVAAEEPRLDGARLRYGENPHQSGYFVRGGDPGEACVLHSRQLSGKELSYNNLLDAEAALELVKEFEAPAAVVIKHTNPCGAAVGETLAEAFERAYAGDPLAAFGGILALNRPLDATLAAHISTRERFFEVLVAPQIGDDALQALRDGAPWGKNLRVLECGDTGRPATACRFESRSLVGGLLVQERDLPRSHGHEVATSRAPTEPEERDLEVAWKVVKHVRSNAIVLVKDGALVGTGAGQMSRVASVQLAVQQAGERARGAVLGSDAFFPFRDGVDAAIRAGVTAVIQPGGSRRDAEVVTACEEGQVAMVFTGNRHFRH